MNKKSKKLTLSSETLRHLTRPDLAEAAGGMPVTAFTDCTCTNGTAKCTLCTARCATPCCQ